MSGIFCPLLKSFEEILSECDAAIGYYSSGPRPVNDFPKTSIIAFK